MEKSGPGLHELAPAPAADTRYRAGHDSLTQTRAGWLTRRSPWRVSSDVPVFVVIFGGLCAWLIIAGLRRLEVARVSYDLGYFTQAAWLITHGHEPLVTVRGLHLLGEHSYWVFYPITWLLKPFPTAEGLIVVQAVALALAVWPLHYLCRRLELGQPATVLVLIAYALFPAMHNVNVADVHPEALVVPAFLAAVAFASTGRWRWYSVAVAFVLLNREDVAITVACLGLLVAFTWSRRTGFATTLVALATLLFNRFWTLPTFSGAGYVHSDQLPYGPGVVDNVVFVLSHPLQLVRDLSTEPNSIFVLALLGPVAFLPLLAARWLLPALPVQLLLLLSHKESAHTIDFQYTAQIIPFVFVAVAFAVHRLRSLGSHRELALKLGSAAVIGCLTLSNDSWLRNGDLWEKPSTQSAAILNLTAAVPSGASVAASPSMWTYLAHRRELYQYPAPAPNFAEWVITELDNPFLVDNPLPRSCKIVLQEDSIILAHCWRQP